MDRRGPDAKGIVKIPLSNGGFCYLLHSRLSILDLDGRANQPMKRGGTTLIFNGEIYNYQELRKELTPIKFASQEEAKILAGPLSIPFLGPSIGKVAVSEWRTESDTETLVLGLDVSQGNLIEKLQGMWAVAAFQHTDESLLLSRDPFGEKPLWLARDNTGIYFASEVECLWILSGQKPELDIDQLKRYIVLGYKSLNKQQHNSFFLNALPFTKNTTLGIGPDRIRYQINHPWKRTITIESPLNMPYEEAVRGVKERLVHSVEQCLQADVPVAFCLSAGIDSTGLMSIAKKIHKYDVHGFHAWVDDPRYLEKEATARYTKEMDIGATFLEIKPEKSLDRMRQFVKWRNAPILTTTFWAQFLLMEQVRAEGYKVCLSGTAADELFCGYFDHPLWQIAELWLHGSRTNGYSNNLVTRKIGDWVKTYGQYVRNEYLKDPWIFANRPDFRDYIYLDSKEFSSYLIKPFEEKFTETHYIDNLLRNRNLNELFEETTPPILHEDDLGAMYWGVENRSPYLNTDLVEFALSIPTEYLIRNGLGKSVLRDALRGLTPDWVLDNPRKIGWNCGVENVINVEECYGEVMAPSPIWDLVDRDKFTKLWIKEWEHDNAHSKFIWSVIQSKLFLEECS
jgi:asparagine synthase (glutamine-hydrolysing)